MTRSKKERRARSSSLQAIDKAVQRDPAARKDLNKAKANKDSMGKKQSVLPFPVTPNPKPTSRDAEMKEANLKRPAEASKVPQEFPSPQKKKSSKNEGVTFEEGTKAGTAEDAIVLDPPAEEPAPTLPPPPSILRKPPADSTVTDPKEGQPEANGEPKTMLQAAQQGTQAGIAPIFLPANVRSGVRQHRGYLEVTISAPKAPDPSEALDHCRDQVVSWCDFVRRNVEESLVILSYAQKDVNESDAWFEPDDVGHSQGAMRKFLLNFRPQAKPHTAYLQMRIGFNPEISAAQTILDLNETSSLQNPGKTTVYESPLQEPFPVCIGWINSSYRRQCAKDYETYLNESIALIFKGEFIIPGLLAPQNHPAIKVACKHKPIYTGLNKEQKKEKGLSTDPVCGMHVWCQRDVKQLAISVVDKLLQHENLRKMNKLETELVPVFDRNASAPDKIKFEALVRQHKSITDKILSDPIPGAMALDMANSKGMTLRTFVMSFKRPPNLRSPLFTDCNPNWDSLEYSVSYSQRFQKEAAPVIANLAAYAYKIHGDSGLEWFTGDMMIVKDLGWDEENNCPVTTSSNKLDRLLKPPPESATCQMFDLSAMENDSPQEKDKAAERPKKDNNSLGESTAAFSRMSSFSKFFNPDGTEKSATDRRQEWHAAGNTGEPPEYTEEELVEKEEAYEEHMQAVNLAVEQRVKSVQEKHDAENAALRSQVNQLQEMMQKVLSKSDEVNRTGDADGAPPAG